MGAGVQQRMMLLCDAFLPLVFVFRCETKKGIYGYWYARSWIWVLRPWSGLMLRRTRLARTRLWPFVLLLLQIRQQSQHFAYMMAGDRPHVAHYFVARNIIPQVIARPRFRELSARATRRSEVMPWLPLVLPSHVRVVHQ